MRKTSAKYLVLGLLFAIAPAARADQFAYVTLPQAIAAMQVVHESGAIRAFCAPCGDATSRAARVRSVGIGRVWDGETARPYRTHTGEAFWELVVNGEGVDLAYVYVARDGRWENLALLLGLEAVRVPRRLAVAQPGE